MGAKLTVLFATPYTTRSFLPDGQVAQLVERGPEKAGVGGSIPSLATIPTGKGLKGRMGKVGLTLPIPLFASHNYLALPIVLDFLREEGKGHVVRWSSGSTQFFHHSHRPIGISACAPGLLKHAGIEGLRCEPGSYRVASALVVSCG